VLRKRSSPQKVRQPEETAKHLDESRKRSSPQKARQPEDTAANGLLESPKRSSPRKQRQKIELPLSAVTSKNRSTTKEKKPGSEDDAHVPAARSLLMRRGHSVGVLQVSNQQQDLLSPVQTSVASRVQSDGCRTTRTNNNFGSLPFVGGDTDDESLPDGPTPLERYVKSEQRRKIQPELERLNDRVCPEDMDPRNWASLSNLSSIDFLAEDGKSISPPKSELRTVQSEGPRKTPALGRTIGSDSSSGHDLSSTSAHGVLHHDTQQPLTKSDGRTGPNKTSGGSSKHLNKQESSSGNPKSPRRSTKLLSSSMEDTSGHPSSPVGHRACQSDDDLAGRNSSKQQLKSPRRTSTKLLSISMHDTSGHPSSPMGHSTCQSDDDLAGRNSSSKQQLKSPRRSSTTGRRLSISLDDSSKHLNSGKSSHKRLVNSQDGAGQINSPECNKGVIRSDGPSIDNSDGGCKNAKSWILNSDGSSIQLSGSNDSCTPANVSDSSMFKRSQSTRVLKSPVGINRHLKNSGSSDKHSLSSQSCHGRVNSPQYSSINSHKSNLEINNAVNLVRRNSKSPKRKEMETLMEAVKPLPYLPATSAPEKNLRNSTGDLHLTESELQDLQKDGMLVASPRGRSRRYSSQTTLDTKSCHNF